MLPWSAKYTKIFKVTANNSTTMNRIFTDNRILLCNGNITICGY